MMKVMQMHPLIEKSWKIAQDLDLTKSEVARSIGTTFGVYQHWLKGREPQKRSLKKVERFIERAEAGEKFKPMPKQEPNKMPLEDLSSDTRTMYEYIYYLEDKYGSLTNVKDDDPVLELLRAEAGA